MASLGLGDVDFVNNTITLDHLAAGLFELPANTPIPREEFHNRIYHLDALGVINKVNILLDPGAENVIDIQHRIKHSNGDIIWVRALKKIAFGQTEDTKHIPQTGLVAIQDITAIKSRELELQNLMKELNHRIKNMLTVVLGIARMSWKSSDEATFMKRFSDRINALMANQDVMVNNNWTDININELIDAHLAPFGVSFSGRISKDGPDIQMTDKAGQAVGLALHELSTNAIKYGALSNATGRVIIDWEIMDSENPTFVMRWKETDGPIVSIPNHTGFGGQVLKTMAATGVGGDVQIEYRPEGVLWTLSAPVSTALADLPNYSRSR